MRNRHNIYALRGKHFLVANFAKQSEENTLSREDLDAWCVEGLIPGAGVCHGPIVDGTFIKSGIDDREEPRNSWGILDRLEASPENDKQPYFPR